MAVVRWEPFRELAALQSEMSRFMNQVWGTPAAGGGNGPSTWLPPLDVWETESDIVMAIDLPGIPEDEVAIEVEDSVLTVSGERVRTTDQEGERFYRFERRYGQFARSVTLPQGVDPSAIKAEFKEGVLEITVPKPEERKPTRVRIGGATGVIEGESTRA
jgi:HSP20 family protein